MKINLSSAIHLSRFTILIPIFVPRPGGASQARSPTPLVITARAFSASFKCVPHRSAAVIEKFGRVRIAAKPAARGGRLPFAVRAANALKIRFVRFFFQSFENFFSSGSFLKRPKNRVKKNRGVQEKSFSGFWRHISSSILDEEI